MFGSGQTEKGETGEEQFILAGQTVNCAYYCDVLWQLRENVQRLEL
jgi:hypothetical protein